MKQRTLAMMTGFERHMKKTRREQFLEEMEEVVPWRELCALVEPHYPKAGNCLQSTIDGRTYDYRFHPAIAAFQGPRLSVCSLYLRAQNG
jgi:hypothetical protein